jgi:23S rRNA (cytidine1920-2'-O)/16S rRNA (cytidine1409-2'-O)-methyltransferase
MKTRLDQSLVKRGLTSSRSQAESYIKLGQVEVNGQQVAKPGFLVGEADEVRLKSTEQYVSRAGLKLASVAEVLKLDFKDKTVLDVGSSTGGFTDYALRRGAKKVIAVDVGTDQLHPSLRQNPKVELHEKTDIRDFATDEIIDIVVADVSFISLREILPRVASIIPSKAEIVAMVKPQFEIGDSSLKHKGVIKNERLRRDILKDFEGWVGVHFVVLDKADSQVAGAKGNRERFYLLRKV